jgi:hypothetical protein
MRNIQNVVDFADICVFAEFEGIAHYNAAHDILDREFYPHDGMRELYKEEVDQYTEDDRAVKILTRFMESKNVDFINITK